MRTLPGVVQLGFDVSFAQFQRLMAHARGRRGDAETNVSTVVLQYLLRNTPEPLRMLVAFLFALKEEVCMGHGDAVAWEWKGTGCEGVGVGTGRGGVVGTRVSIFVPRMTGGGYRQQDSIHRRRLTRNRRSVNRRRLGGCPTAVARPPALCGGPRVPEAGSCVLFVASWTARATWKGMQMQGRAARGDGAGGGA